MLSVSIRSSQTVRSSLAEQSLIWAMGKVLTDTIQCKANLKPTSGRLTGSDNEQGRGTLSTLIQGLGDPNVDDFTLVEIGDFKNSLEVVKMELQGNTGNPKTSTVKRDFVVYYKKKGVGTLENKPCDSSNIEGCYFQTCSLQYELQNASNPDVTVCDVQNCTGIAGGNHVAGISCGGGKYLKGFDNNGNKICEDLGECAANQYLKGFDSSGNKICEISQKDQSCPSGQYLKGFDNNGNKMCQTLLKVYKNETQNRSLVNWFTLNQSKDKVYCDAGDVAIGGGGSCARCDTAGVHPACSLLGGLDPQGGYFVRSGNREGYLYFCDYNNNGISDTVYTQVVCLDSSPPYRP